jgi:hypothetical protein
VKIDNFFAELNRRNVIRMAGLYLVGARLPQGLKRDEDVRPEELIVLAIVIGFPIALVIAWAFELTACSKQLR